MAENWGDKGGDRYDDLVAGIRDRLNLLLSNPHSNPRAIRGLIMSLKMAQEMALLTRKIALADQQLLGKTSGSDMIEVTEEAEKRALQRKADRTSS